MKLPTLLLGVTTLVKKVGNMLRFQAETQDGELREGTWLQQPGFASWPSGECQVAVGSVGKTASNALVLAGEDWEARPKWQQVDDTIIHSTGPVKGFIVCRGSGGIDIVAAPGQPLRLYGTSIEFYSNSSSQAPYVPPTYIDLT